MGDLVEQARALVADPLVSIDVVTSCASTREFVGLLADEIEHLRRFVIQKCPDCGIVVAPENGSST